MRLWAWGALALGIGFAGACAQGSEDGATATKSTKDTTKPEAGDDSSAADDDDTSSGDDDSVVTPKLDSGAGDGSAPKDAGSDTGTVTPVSCDATNDCPSGDDMGTVSGDTGGTLSTTGNTSQWLTFMATEDIPISNPLAVTVTLEVPSGEGYELYLYQSASTAGPTECTTPTVTSTKVGSKITTGGTWGDTGFTSDNSLFAVEVRHVSGACDPAKKWKLKVEGAVAP